MNEQKYTIEVNKEQLRLIADCLEDISRFASGQPNLEHTVGKMLRGGKYIEDNFDEYLNRRDEAREKLRQAKRALIDIPDNSSYGYNGGNAPEKLKNFIGNTYQIYRTILYHIAVEENWNNAYSYPALKSGNLGIIKIEKL